MARYSCYDCSWTGDIHDIKHPNAHRVRFMRECYNRTQNALTQTVVDTLRPLVGKAIIVSGAGGVRREHLKGAGYYNGLPFVETDERGMRVGNDAILWSYGGFVVKEDSNA